MGNKSRVLTVADAVSIPLSRLGTDEGSAADVQGATPRDHRWSLRICAILANLEEEGISQAVLTTSDIKASVRTHFS